MRIEANNASYDMQFKNQDFETQVKDMKKLPNLRREMRRARD
jgi:hypothetical protein